MELQQDKNATPLGDDARQLAMYLIDTYFKTQAYPFTKHHIDSYDQFLGKDLPALIRAANPILILKDKIPNTDEYRYKVEIFIGGEDGSAIEIGSPTVALQNTEEVRLLFPNEARLRNLTYSSLVMADIVCRISISATDPKQPGLVDVQRHERTFAKFPLFRIPIMLHSRYCNLHGKAAEFLEEAGECPQDYGGYFIVDGSEKVLITKQEQAFNTLYVNTQDHDKKISFFASISCLSPSTRQVKRISFYFMREFQVKRIIGDRPDRQYATLQVGLPYVRKPVPVFILFRALGYQTDKEIMRLILPDETSAETKLLEPYLIASMNEAFPFLDSYSAVQYIKSLTKGFSEAHVLDVLNNQFFIHIDVNQPGARAAFLGDCVRRILRVVAGLEPKTDKDDTRNQRLLVSGFSTQMLFSSIYDMWKKAVALSIDKQYNYNEKLYSGLNFLNIFSAGNTSLIFQPIMITEGIMRGFKGRWGTGLGEDKAGLIQQLSRLSYLDFLSHCRRVVLDFDTGMKLTGPRHLHPSQFGYFCTSEVPSGAAIGITKNLTILTSISTSSDPLPIGMFLYKKGWVLPCAAATEQQRAAYVPFFLNGGILGYCLEPVKVTRALSLMKRTACLPPYASVGFSMRDRRVFLYVDEGRPLRPLIYVNKQVFPLQKFKELKTWRELVCGSLHSVDTSSTEFFDPLADKAKATPDDYIAALESHCGAIEYVDPYEQNETLIATFPEYIIEETTHVEIHPSTILSVLTGVIPFPNHNQSPRNQLGDSQSKQGLSMYATNWQNRYDNMAHVLCYGEAPLVRTLYYDYIGGGKMSYGQNIILAIAAFTGYNQEDGIVMNQDSVQRGLFRSIAYKSYEAFEEDDPISKAKTRIGNPAKIASWTDMKPGVDYSKLDDTGLVKVGEYVDEHTVICGRYIQLPTGTMKDASITGQVWTRGRVEKIAITVSPMGLRLVKIRVVQDRTPELGDKFCLTADHDVLTRERGWIPINNVTVDDQVAQLNITTNKMEYVKPLETFVFDHSGDMYEVETQGVSLKATLNHRMWVEKRNETKYSFEIAQNIVGKRVRYQSDGPIGIEDQDIQIDKYLFTKGEKANAWICFFGIWIAEGWTYIKEKDYLARVEFSANKGRVLTNLIDSCDILGWNYSYNETSEKFYVNEKGIAQYLEPLSIGATNKKLPQWTFGLSAEQSKYLVNSLCLGDGHETKTSLHYSTSSIALRDDIQQLCQHAGWTSYYAKKCEEGWVSKTPNKNGVFFKANKDNWDIGIRRTRLRPTVNHGHTRTQGGQKEEIQYYEGKVYCISVPSQVFLVRRNARIVWTGNSNRHGQKGTIGMLIRAHDMPRSASGIVPDFIMNPHAIPSRMTIGQLLENLFGKAAANIGAVGNGTPFMNQGSPHEEAGATLERLGFEKYGNEILYNGQTGEQIPSAIFMAPVFGMRLKHMTEDKWNARGEGRKEQLTHQPTGGRGNQGGLRIGEMERDAISGHGISAFVRESFMKRSDGTGFIICNSCGTIPIYNERQGLYVCALCDGPVQFAGENSRNLELIPPVKRTKASFSRIEEPYAMKVLGQELETYMNISMRYLTEGSLRRMRPIKGAPGEDVDITILQSALPTRIIPTMVETPQPVVTAPIESITGSIMSAITPQTQPQPQQTQPQAQTHPVKENPLENLSGMPKIPQVFSSIKPLQEVIETQQQEVALVEPQQFQQQPPQTLTEGLIANQIGISQVAPQIAYAIPTQAPPAQVLVSPTAVTPVIMVDTTQQAMTAEGLAQQQPQLSQQTIRVKRPQVRFQEPAQQGGGEDEGNSRGYSQQIQIMKLG
jgi:DNA-directed RNA polymerase II subunit RPB2